MTKDGPLQLWKRAEAGGGSKEQIASRYRGLLIEHGLLIVRPKCHDCSQTSLSRIHHDPALEGAHEFKPMLVSADVALQLAYVQMPAEEAQVYWEQAHGNPESFEALVRHAVSHEFRILGGERAQADFDAGKKGGYAFEIVNKGDGSRTTGMACVGSHGAERMPRCEWCRSRAGTDECDFVVGETCKVCKGTKPKGLKPCPKCAGRGVQLCNRRFCGKREDGRCGVRLSNDEGYCPKHMTPAGHAPKPSLASNRVTSSMPAGKSPRPTLEECRWADSEIEGTCLHKGCPRVVRPGERCLYFPARRRAMCERCGDEYLMVAR